MENNEESLDSNEKFKIFFAKLSEPAIAKLIGFYDFIKKHKEKRKIDKKKIDPTLSKIGETTFMIIFHYIQLINYLITAKENDFKERLEKTPTDLALSILPQKDEIISNFSIC